MPADEATSGAARASDKPVTDAPRPPPAECERDPLRVVAQSIAELCEQLRVLLRVRADRLRLEARARLRATLISVGVRVGGLIVAVIALVYIVQGVALGLAELTGGRAWLGYLLAGVLFLAAALGAIVGVGWLSRSQSLQRTTAKYAKPDCAVEEYRAAQPQT